MYTSKGFNGSKSTPLYYNTTSKSEHNTEITEEGEENEIVFSDKSRKCCVCFVSMVDPINANLKLVNHIKIRRYYSVFINTMAAIARNFNAKIIKNTASSLIFYFPKTCTISIDSSSFATSSAIIYESAFRDVI